VVIDDFNVFGIAIGPAKTDAPLVIDSNAVLPSTVTAEFLDPITGRDAEILQLDRRVDEAELAEHRAPEVRGIAADRFPLPQARRVAVSEAPNHLV
jgi:hypothetical protein